MAARGRMRFDTQFFRLPCVPMTTWSTTRSRLHRNCVGHGCHKAVSGQKCLDSKWQRDGAQQGTGCLGPIAPCWGHIVGLPPQCACNDHTVRARLKFATLISTTAHLENLLSVAAVDVALMDVNLAMRSSTLRFWTTSSRVGQMHSACAQHSC